MVHFEVIRDTQDHFSDPLIADFKVLDVHPAGLAGIKLQENPIACAILNASAFPLQRLSYDCRSSSGSIPKITFAIYETQSSNGPGLLSGSWKRSLAKVSLCTKHQKIRFLYISEPEALDFIQPQVFIGLIPWFAFEIIIDFLL